MAGTESLVLSKKRHPTWAIVLGVIGLFVFLIGIVFFA
jgi:hypothetical protein